MMSRLCSIFLLIGLIACGNPSSKQSNTSNTPTQTNAANELGTVPDDRQLVFTERLRFGATEEDSHYDWLDGHVTTSFDVDQRGHIFVADPKQNRVLEFNSKGAFVQQVARQGEGPGEYQMLSSFHILADDRALGFEALSSVAKFTFYEQGLHNPKTKVMTAQQGLIAMMTPGPYARWYAALLLKHDDTLGQFMLRTTLLNERLEETRVFRTAAWPMIDPARLNDPSFWEGYLAQHIRGRALQNETFASFLDDGRILIVHAKEYRIEVWDARLTLKEREIRKKFNRVRYDEAAKQIIVDSFVDTILQQAPQFAKLIDETTVEKALEKAELPPFQFPIRAIIPLQQGFFWVVTDLNESSGQFRGDILAADGRGEGRARFPGMGAATLNGIRVVFKNDLMYAMERTENGDNQLAVYSYEWQSKQDH